MQETKPTFRKLMHFSQNEMKILDGAIEVGIARNTSDAIHVAVDLLRGHVEMKKGNISTKEG